MLEARLRMAGLDNTISNVDLLDADRYIFVQPNEAAERCLILLAVAFTAYNFEQSEKVMDWLKKEELWKSVSVKEKEFFRHPDPDEDEKQNLSWRFEGAYMLAWTLSLVSKAPVPYSECRNEEVSEFLQGIPTIGSSTEEFFKIKHRFRALPEIVEERLFYQIATNYFRDLLANDKENTCRVHSRASHERHFALNWLRIGAVKSDWDAIA